MISIFRVIKFAIQGFFRNFWLSLVTITMILMALFSVTLLVSMDYIKQATVDGIKKKVDVLVSFKVESSREDLDNIIKDLGQLPEVKKVKIITPEENRQLYEQSNITEEAKRALDIFSENENPFGYSLAIQAYELDQYQAILNFVQQEKYLSLVDSSDFKDYDAFVNNVKKLADIINKYSWYVIAMFLFVAIVVIFNTIRISIYSRQNEVIIMKLVGADSWFVRAPFILEGIIYALIAVAILIAIVYPIVDWIQPTLTNYFQDSSVINLQNYFRQNFAKIFVSEFLVLSVINIVSTVIAMRRYLKV